MHEVELDDEVEAEGVQTVQTTSVLLVIFAWSVVALALGWGIYNTLINAAKFFN